MTADKSSAATVSITDAGEFLAEYTAWLWGCGATCLRIEKNVSRIADRWGLGCEITVMPRNVSISLSPSETADARHSLFTARIKQCGINFSMNTTLSRLSWRIADRGISVDEARRSLAATVGAKYRSGITTLAMVALANASFCRLFGGDAAAMLVVFVATAAGYAIKELLLRHHTDLRVTFFLCAFISSALSAGGLLFGFGDTPDIALATSVLYLIPGVPYINSASDLIDHHYLCSFSRFIDACVLTACLSAGLCAGIGLMGINWF